MIPKTTFPDTTNHCNTAKCNMFTFIFKNINVELIFAVYKNYYFMLYYVKNFSTIKCQTLAAILISIPLKKPKAVIENAPELT